MLPDLIVEVAFVSLCAAIFYACLCRIAHMSERRTVPAARRAVVLLAVAAAASIFAVLFWGFKPQWPALMLPAGYLSMLHASRRLWTNGQPPEYRR